MTEPTSLRGYVDDNGLNSSGVYAAIDYLLDNIPALVHPESVITYARMRHDPMITAIIEAYAAAIERARWSVDPAGCRDEVVEQTADNLGLPIKGYNDEPDDNDPDAKVMKQTGARRRGFTWGEHLRMAGLDRLYGHMFFEQAWVEENGQWQLAEVQERMPQTIAAVHLDKNGRIDWVEQGSMVGSNSTAGKLTTSDHRLVYYTRKREGSNYFGQSLIRPCYGPWLIKDQVMRVHATSIRKFGMGIPEVAAPVDTPQAIAQAQRYATQIAAGEKTGAGLPPGYVSSWKGMTGSVPDALAFLNFLNQEMTRSTFTVLLTMAGAERGNRSLGETVMDLLIAAQQSDAQFHAAEATRQLVIPLVDANWGANEPAPQISVGDVGADLELTAQDVYWLMAYGGISPDDPWENWLRGRYGAPPADPRSRHAQGAPPAQPDPNAPPTPSSGGQQ